MNIGIVLAAGKGKRFGSGEFNKTTAVFAGKPLVKYATDLFSKVAEKIIVVVGVGAEGVVSAIGNNPKLLYVKQEKRLGTGHAARVAVEAVSKIKLNPKYVWVGYGDHMMFYTSKIIKKLPLLLDTPEKVVGMITCEHKDPDSLAWGRVIRNKDNEVIAVVEQKEANHKQRKIKELNAGFYCFRWDFLRDGIRKLKRSSVTGEYYLTDMISIAIGEGNKIVGVKIPIEYVGLGINTREELIKSERMFLKRK
jgi:bifunctional UDP-N-acetylglucosamine pyrophosphorylase / glucosamine-1-phosphate N-acetyltransferase